MNYFIFHNLSTGAVIYCSVNGNPMPKVYWETKNDQIITDVTGKSYAIFLYKYKKNQPNKNYNTKHMQFL